eukprot:gene9155-9323_t
MAAAEQGTVINRLYKLGKRVLDGIPAEERLMRGVPKNISKVIIHHPSQVLTYYTMWELYRNTNGALGTTRMTRLDKYHDLANDSPEGVLTEDDIDALVTDLREPDLLEALLSLRSKALREAGKRTSRSGEEYVALPRGDPAGAAAGGWGSSSTMASSSRS